MDNEKIYNPDKEWFLKAKCHVLLPNLAEAEFSSEEFEAHLAVLFKPKPEVDEAADTPAPQSPTTTLIGDEFIEVSEPSAPAAAGANSMTQAMQIDSEGGAGATTAGTTVEPATDPATVQTAADPTATHPFVTGLQNFSEIETADASTRTNLEGMMQTDNGALAFTSTKNPLVDLFYELKEGTSPPNLRQLHEAAWQEDAELTLKIIFNARSIHLGKASKHIFYRSAGWLAKNHPLTLIANLRWLSRPVIPKKAEKNKDAGGDEEMVSVSDAEMADDVTKYDVRNGVAHGYWKDVLNMLALCANDKLDILEDPATILNVERPEKGKPAQKAQDDRADLRNKRHEAVLGKLKGESRDDVFYRALHVAVARLFAEQLKTDMKLLYSKDPEDKKKVSLCAKWAPSTDRFHDKHTFVASTIAEIIFPDEKNFVTPDYIRAKGDHEKRMRETPGSTEPPPPPPTRDVYLRHIRDDYRRCVAKLRKHLDVVERHISANQFEAIKYDRVPSIAMSNYSTLFAKKDKERFEEYIKAVASGKARISGATLLPSTLIKAIRNSIDPHASSTNRKKRSHAMMQESLSNIESSVAEGQWKSLVQRVRNSGKMESSIAVCDTSGSMSAPQFKDGTCPLDSAIGLSLLLAEVTEPPFGGTFITFSQEPEVQTVSLNDNLKDKYTQLSKSHWEMNTNFEAVFTKLILPMAVENNLAPEQMVKRVFVFSDMQFDEAHGIRPQWGQPRSVMDKWSTSYERIQGEFKEAGYEVPEMVFWNLAGGKAGYSSDPTAPKPVQATEPGVSLVSGYSQGMLKVFLENGGFTDVGMDEVELKDVEDDMVAVEASKKVRVDPLSTVKKAVSHKAYNMLKVVD
ncbi:hypothetical protein OQA88_8901 [Cercophora sp. LCS_1]